MIYNFQLAIDGKRQRLVVNNAGAEDGGTYALKIGSEEEYSSKATLTVQKSTVYFKKKLPDITRVMEETTELELSVEVSEESVSVSWFCNGKSVKKVDRFKSTKKGTKRTLKISKVEREDTEWSCTIDSYNVTTKTRVVREGELFYIDNLPSFCLTLCLHRNKNTRNN